MTNYVEIYFYEGLINVANIIPVMFKVNISMWMRRLETKTHTHREGESIAGKITCPAENTVYMDESML